MLEETISVLEELRNYLIFSNLMAYIPVRKILDALVRDLQRKYNYSSVAL